MFPTKNKIKKREEAIKKTLISLSYSKEAADESYKFIVDNFGMKDSY